jgi:hypothetical protein
MNSLRRKGVVFSLSIAGLVIELRLSGDAMMLKLDVEKPERRFTAISG